MSRWAMTIAMGLLALGCPSSGSGRKDAGARASDAAAATDASREAGTLALAPDAGVEEMLPPSSSEEMTARVRHLLEAIAHDNPDLGTDMLFPREAYLAARDSADPGKAWDAKVSSAFRRAVHKIHQRTHGIEKAQFVSFEIGRSVEQHPPKRRDWKTSLWRVKHSHLTFTVDGKTQRLEIGEMTGWHGNWYVTKLR